MPSKWRVERSSSNLQSYVPENVNHCVLTFFSHLNPFLPLSPSSPPLLVVDCGGLTDPLNGQVALNSTTFQSVAAYECDSGFNLEGDMERTCQASGEWSGTAPTCNRMCQKMLITLSFSFSLSLCTCNSKSPVARDLWSKTIQV